MWNPRICRTNLGAWASLREFWPPWEVWEPIPYDTEPTVISVCRKHRIQVQSLGTQMGRIDSPELMYHQGPLTCIKKIGIIFVFALFYFSLHSLAKKVKALKMKCQERFFSPLPVLKWSWGIAAAAKSLPQIAGEILFLSVTARVFPGEISIWFGRLRAWMAHKGGERENLVSVNSGISIFSCPQTLALLFLKSSDAAYLDHWIPGSQPFGLGQKPHLCLSWASSLQRADHGTF